MKKKRIIGVLIVLLLICLLVFILIKVFKKDYSKNLIGINDSSLKVDNKGIVKKLDIDVDDITFINDKYIVYLNNGTYNITDYNMKNIIGLKENISYNYENDCYMIEDNSSSVVYCKTLDSKGLLFKVTKNDRLIEKTTIDDNAYYIVIDANNKRKLYYPGYINGYVVKEYSNIAVFDKYVVVDKKLIDTEGEELGEIDSYYNVGNKYVLLKGEKSYLYDLENHKMESYNKVSTKNGYYALDNKFLSKDGEWLDTHNKDRRKITDLYYIDYSDCDQGFRIYKKNKKYNDTCYQSVRRVGNKVLIGNSYEAEYIAIFDNNKVVDTGNVINSFGNLVSEVSKGKNNYYNEDGLMNYSCDGTISTNNSPYICSKDNEAYFMDESLKKVSDVYDSITCHGNNCIVEKNGKFGITNGVELATSIDYPDITYIYDNGFFVSRSVKNQLLLLGDKDFLTDLKYEEFQTGIDVNKVINDYGLSSIKSYIDKDPELFKKFAYVAINNQTLKPYLKQILMNFKTIEINKKQLNEKQFLDNLKILKIIVKKNLDVAGAAGLYYDGFNPRIEMLENKEYIFYHEFMHFIDHKLNKEDEYLYKRVCRIGDKYYNSLEADSDKCSYEDLSISYFLVEAGAETNIIRNFKIGSLAYGKSVLLYNALAYLIGEDKMNDVYYSSNTEEMLFLELSKYGVTINEYKDFLNSINKWTNIRTTGILKDLADSINFVTDLYYKKYNKSWSNDKVFSMFMRLLINWSDYYDYTNGVKLTPEELIVVKNKVAYNNYLKTINSKYVGNGEGVLVLSDGKYYLSMLFNDGKKFKVAFMEYDVNNDKILSTIERTINN